MKYKTTIILLTGIAALFLSSFSFKSIQFEKRLPAVAMSDTIKTLFIPVDSLEAMGNLKYKPFKEKVHASYYHDKFNGRRTASGIKFSNNKYTAAHRKLPFGTKLRITNAANGKCVVVEVNDRGPFTKGREIDMSKRAFMDIADNKKSGGMNVSIEIIE